MLSLGSGGVGNASRRWRCNRSFLPSLVLGAVVACLPLFRATRPDLILVIIDAWRWDALGANGSTNTDVTPQLDSLAAEGVRFSRAFASSPWTLASVASIVTGHYPTVHGAYGRYTDVGAIRGDLSTLAEILAENGYRTLAVINAPFLDPHFGFERGFERFDYFPSTNEVARRAGEAVDAALGLLGSEATDEPVFLLLHLFDPHLAYDPPPPWDRRWTGDYRGSLRPPIMPLDEMRSGSFNPSEEDLAYVRALYDGEVGYVDHELGRFFRELDPLRAGRERLVVVTADHGEEFGEHGGWEHGHTMHRELVQVPLIISPPASLGVRPRAVDTQVRLLDIFPTFLEAAGVEPPGGGPGRSLLPLLRDSEGERDRPAYTEREHLGVPSSSIRDGRHALIVLKDDSVLLFDQREDPTEIRDVASQYPGRVRTLEGLLQTAQRVLEQRARSLGSSEPAEQLDPELEGKLRSLGYLGD